MYTTGVLQLPCTRVLQSAQQVAKERSSFPQVLQSSTNQNKPGKYLPARLHTALLEQPEKLSASPLFSYIGKTTPFASALPDPLNCQQHLPSLHNWTHSPWDSPVVTLK